MKISNNKTTLEWAITPDLPQCTKGLSQGDTTKWHGILDTHWSKTLIHVSSHKYFWQLIYLWWWQRSKESLGTEGIIYTFLHMYSFHLMLTETNDFQLQTINKDHYSWSGWKGICATSMLIAISPEELQVVTEDCSHWKGLEGFIKCNFSLQLEIRVLKFHP